MMKTTRFLLALALASMMMVSCSKPEGDDVPSVFKSISVNIDSTGVFKITTQSVQGLVIDTLKLCYYTSSDHVVKLPVRTKVSISEANPFCDTIWDMEPQTKYYVYYHIREFFDADTYTNKEEPDSVITCRPGALRVTADTAILRHDTLCLQGTVNSLWRSLLKENGYADMKFLWGTSVMDVNQELQAVPVNVELDNTKTALTIKMEAYLLKQDYQGLDNVFYKAHAKSAWGNGESSSGIRSVSIH